MSKRFTFMKSILMFAVILLTAFTLVACGEDNQALVDEALDSVSLVFASGDSATSVTQNLTLPTTVGDVQITWESDNTAVISNAGVVTRQTADTDVVLTATLTLGEATATKDFTLKVLAIVVVIDPVEALDAIEITGDLLGYTVSTGRYNTKANIVLPTTSMTLTVVWTSSNPAVLSNTGVVVRPAYGSADSTVILTATIGEETKEFVVTVLAITEKPASLILQEAHDALLLSGISSGVSTNLTLPVTVGTEGVTVTWSSDTPESITDAGVVVRAAENVTVTLTATLHIGELTMTKEFEVVVLSFAPTTDVADIAAAIAADLGTYVKVPDVTVVGVSSDSYMIYDGTTILQVYTGGTPPAEVVEGAVFTISGVVTYYLGVMELTGTTEMPIMLVASDATAAVLTPTVLTGSVSDYIATLPTSYTAESPLVYQYIQITAKVRVQDTTNYGTFLVNTNHDGSAIDSSANSPYTTNALMIYYKSNIGTVRVFDGLDVTMNVFLFSLRTDRNIYTVVFLGEAADIQTTLDDAGIVNVVKTALTASFTPEYTVESTIALPSSMLGTTIVWDTASEYVNLTTGLVTMPTTPGQVDVTLTATLTRGLATDTVTITFKVGELPILTMAEARALTLGSLVRVQGIISGFSVSAQYGNAAVFLQDDTGGLFIYRLGSSFVSSLAIGTEVDIIGTTAAYHGLIQITNVTQFNVVSTGNTLTPVAVDANTVLLDAQGELTTISGYLSMDYTLSGTGTLYFEFVNSFGTFKAAIVQLSDSSAAQRDPIIAAINTAEVATLVTIVAPLDWYDAALFRIYTLDQITLGAVGTALEVTDLIVANTTLPVASAEVVADIALPLAGILGSTVTWTSDTPLVIAIDGTVVRPVFGEADVVVTLTYEIKLGDTVLATDSIIFTVLAETEAPVAAVPVRDLIISEYVEPSTGNSKALEIYNAYFTTVDLSDYAIVQYNNGKVDYAVEYILPLVGTLNQGEVFVAYNPDSDPAMIALVQANADVYQAGPAFGTPGGNVLGFNGDDGIVLMKKDTNGDYTIIVDAIGKAAVDPGSAWTGTGLLGSGETGTVSTANLTLVRKNSVNFGRIDYASDFDPAIEWIAWPAQTWTNLGLHDIVISSVDLFISEYVEPSTGNSKALEIYNNTNTTVDLSDYAIVQYNNGKVDYAVEYILPLVGTLNQGEVFVAYNPDSDPAMIALVQANADVYQAGPAFGTPGGNVLGFNGDDGIVLMKKDTNGDYTIIVDAIGKAAVDPGSAWTGTGLLGSGETGTVSTANLTLVRKSSVLDGRTDYASDFDPAIEWIAWPAQTWTDLGLHTMN